jgi:hypothetical protein
VCQLLDIIILCSKIYLDYFWCIKYQYIYNRKRKGKNKKEKRFPQLAGPGGGDSAQPSAGACGQAVHLACQWGDGAVGTGPRARGRGRLTALGGGEGGGGEPVGA